jgi:hypothetical protein
VTPISDNASRQKGESHLPPTSHSLRTARRSGVAIATLLLLSPLLSSCQALYFLGGKGTQPALYTLPKASRILVFVDPRSTVSAPVDFPSALGEKIAAHLYKYGVADKFVAQERLTALSRDHAKFATMGIADVARATEADVVIYVDLISYEVNAISDESIAQGSVHVLVKVLDHNGDRLWPKDAPTGIETGAKIDPALTTDRDQAAVLKMLTDTLAIHVGRMFQKYDAEDPVLAR